MLDLSVHKIFTKDLNKAQLNPTISAKLFLYILLFSTEEELPKKLKTIFNSEWKDTKEILISSDLLINKTTLQLLRIGTHSQLFNKIITVFVTVLFYKLSCKQAC